MTDHITPEDQPGGDLFDQWFDAQSPVPVDAGRNMARMLAGARVEYAIARDSDYGWTEYFTDWGGWTESKVAAWWHPNRACMEKRLVDGARIITRLVIDLEEEP